MSDKTAYDPSRFIGRKLRKAGSSSFRAEIRFGSLSDEGGLMARKRFIAQDRWCVTCSQPAALLVVTVAKDDPTLRPVCSYPHGEQLIKELARQDDAENEGRVPTPLVEGTVEQRWLEDS